MTNAVQQCESEAFDSLNESNVVKLVHGQYGVAVLCI